MTLSFKGHTVVVTGAGGGLGRASVLRLFPVVIVGRIAFPQVFRPLRLARRERRSKRFQQRSGAKSR